MRPTALATVALALAACGGGEGPTRPLLQEIGPAIAAVEAELGGPQQLFEVTAEAQSVRLFVALDDATIAVPYLYVGDELAPAGPSQGAEGQTFGADDVTFDPSTILDRLDDDLDRPDIVQFSIGRDAGGELDYLVLVQSDDGGVLEVVLGPDGAVQSADPRPP